MATTETTAQTDRDTTGRTSGPAAQVGAGATSDAGRPIAQVADSFVVIEGPGVPVRRALPSRAIPIQRVDPWLLLDHGVLDRATIEGLGSDPGLHPHRGFEILSYLVEGAMGHIDSEGNNDVLRAGDVQRITAGRGIWHGGTLVTAPAEALQLWINLARVQKGLPPSYQAVAAAAIPEHQVGDATVRVLVGAGSPLRLHTPALSYDVALPPHGQTALDVPAGFQGFVYVLQGVVALGSTLAARTPRKSRCWARGALRGAPCARRRGQTGRGSCWRPASPTGSRCASTATSWTDPA